MSNDTHLRSGHSPARVGGSAAVRRVTWIGLWTNVALIAVKFAGGILGRSQAVVADAVHSLSDLTTDAAILVGVRYWSAPADENHPYGHQRIETLVTMLIGGVLVAVAVGIGYNAIWSVHKGPAGHPGWVAFWAALVSIVSKEILYRYTIAVGRRIRSTAVLANAWHHRSDALSSFPAALAVLGATISPAWRLLDPIGALVVSIMILQAAWKIVRPALAQLTDTGAPRETLDAIETIARGVENVRQVHAIRTRYAGSGLEVDLHVLVDPRMTVEQGHEISSVVKRRLIEQGPDVVDVVVHLEPFHPAAGRASSNARAAPRPRERKT